jgi:NAD(P)H-hydrate epimerase
LGKSAESVALLKAALKANLPLVLDADALNILAENTELLEILPAQSILTPHIGELYRLIGKATSPEQLLEKQKVFCEKYGVFIIQKGAYSKLTTPEGQVFINSSGNSAMASAGMGDALTGMIGSFLAQGYSPVNAAKNGMFYHGSAGDLAVRHKGSHGLVTSDIIEFIPNALNGL